MGRVVLFDFESRSFPRIQIPSVMKQVSTVLLGLGRIAWMLEKDRLRYHPCTHAGSLKNPGIRKNPFHLVGACDLIQERLDDFSSYWKKPLLRSKEASEVLALRPDLAVIAASLPSHFDLVRAAQKSGVCAIVLEKPPAANLKEATRLLTLCDQTNVWVNFERRYHPGYRKVKDIIDSKLLGEMRSIRGRVLVGGSHGAGEAGPLLHDAIHWIDLLLWFAGKPKRAFARMMRNTPDGGEHTAFATFEFSDFSAVLESGGRRKYFEFEMEIDFAAGRIYCGNNGFRMEVSKPSRKYSRFNELRTARPLFKKTQNPWQNLYQEVASVSRGQSATIHSSLASAVEAMKVIEMLEKNQR